MKASPIKDKAERRTFDCIAQEVAYLQRALHTGVRRPVPGPFDRCFGQIKTRHLEAMLCQPNGVIAHTASKVQGAARLDGMVTYRLGQVEIG
jgi:hypothetical protein